MAGPPPHYQTVVVDTTGTVETQARALAAHATQVRAVLCDLGPESCKLPSPVPSLLGSTD